MDLDNKIQSAKDIRDMIVGKYHWDNELTQLYEIHLTIEEAQEIQDELDNLRERVSAQSEVITDMLENPIREDLNKLWKVAFAAEFFLAKVLAIVNSEAYRQTWAMGWIHGAEYKGENFTAEQEVLEKALAALDGDEND